MSIKTDASQLACFAQPVDLDSKGYLFVLAPQTGAIISGLMQLTHAKTGYRVQSEGFLLQGNMIYMVFNHLGLGAPLTVTPFE